jgi:hypothetical protein
MKVRHLITILQTLDPELPVVRQDDSYPDAEIRHVKYEPAWEWVFRVAETGSAIICMGPCAVLES